MTHFIIFSVIVILTAVAVSWWEIKMERKKFSHHFKRKAVNKMPERQLTESNWVPIKWGSSVGSDGNIVPLIQWEERCVFNENGEVVHHGTKCQCENIAEK